MLAKFLSPCIFAKQEAETFSILPHTQALGHDVPLGPTPPLDHLDPPNKHNPVDRVDSTSKGWNFSLSSFPAPCPLLQLLFCLWEPASLPVAARPGADAPRRNVRSPAWRGGLHHRGPQCILRPLRAQVSWQSTRRPPVDSEGSFQGDHDGRATDGGAECPVPEGAHALLLEGRLHGNHLL